MTITIFNERGNGLSSQSVPEFNIRGTNTDQEEHTSSINQYSIQPCKVSCATVISRTRTTFIKNKSILKDCLPDAQIMGLLFDFEDVIFQLIERTSCGTNCWRQRIFSDYVLQYCGVICYGCIEISHLFKKEFQSYKKVGHSNRIHTWCCIDL